MGIAPPNGHRYPVFEYAAVGCERASDPALRCQQTNKRNAAKLRRVGGEHFGDAVDDFFHHRLVVAFAHDADHGLGA